jgi:hypothetical protein
MKEAAAALDGNQYREEGSRDLFAAMKAARLVAVYGASDDLMEFSGAINDELGAFDGATAYLTKDGLLENECDSEECPHFKQSKKSASTITAMWCPGDPYCSWAYSTSIPHETFRVMEDDDLYCVGIVFSLDRLE